MIRPHLPVLFAVAFLASAATADGLSGDFVVGVGPTDFDDDDVAVFELEYHSKPIWNIGRTDISVSGAVVVGSEGNFFVGGGVSAQRPLSNDWFIEASFAPGYYEDGGPTTDLGNDLEFRTLIGVGRSLANGTKLSVGLSHISNGGLGDNNPGVNAVTLRFRF